MEPVRCRAHNAGGRLAERPDRQGLAIIALMLGLATANVLAIPLLLRWAAPVLLGAETENVRKFGHAALPTFGIGAEFKREGWRSVMRQLLAMGVIDLDTANWGAPFPTERGRRVLKGIETVSIRQPSERRLTQRKSRPAAPPPDLNQADSRVLAQLKTLRLAIAREQGVPAYVVFNDRTLISMASRLPRTLDAMAEVHGVGRAKLEKFGVRFLEALNAEA